MPVTTNSTTKFHNQQLHAATCSIRSLWFGRFLLEFLEQRKSFSFNCLLLIILKLSTLYTVVINSSKPTIVYNLVDFFETWHCKYWFSHIDAQMSSDIDIGKIKSINHIRKIIYFFCKYIIYCRVLIFCFEV